MKHEPKKVAAPEPVFPCTVYRMADVLVQSVYVNTREEYDALAADGWSAIFPEVAE